MMKKLIPASIFSLLITLTFATNAHATVGPASGRMYFDWCASDLDTNCFESVSFKTPNHDYGSLVPDSIIKKSESFAVFIFTLDGYKGPDGSNVVRVEARIDNSQALYVEAGGFNTVIPSPRPKVCDTDPAALPVCPVLGDLSLDLQISVVLRIKDLNPGVSIGALDKLKVNLSKASFGTRLNISAQPLRYMGYIRYEGMTNGDALDRNLTGDYIAGRWHFALLDQKLSPFGKCNSAGAAFVQSNAEYSNAPTWNSDLKSLDMQTASSHFEPDGVTPFKGIYSASLSADLVKCAWGINAEKAASLAQVQIVSNSGDNSVATILSNYRDGWLNLDARNYEYSKPLIRVKMGNSASNAGSKTTITCINKKVSKKVSGLNPTCPSGFKRK